ncbi:putative B3 domain-containing protein At5g66980 [Vigna radiata var. radiata]|uniref:B3 domain-containing protein At5g66980 n=1 Tax=Vigna radiata var. radiata TaxID=3916 RepID=A0A3Q0FGJ0_VIGRR|nr:putative B3 domain-containing protein At5g66980 [Vigna radiata var. radiata]
MENPGLSCGDKTPQEFFKVFLTRRGSTQLQIPRSFTKFFTGIPPCKVVLVEQDGKHWDVKVEIIEGGLVFKSGWQEFAKEKKLEDCDFLVFEYDGKTTFNVKIFGKTGCRKVAAPPKVVPIVNLEEDSDEHSNEIQNNGVRKRPLPSSKTNVKSEGACPFKGAQHRSKRIKEGKDKMNDEKPGLTKHVPLENGHFQICFDSEYKLKRVEFPRKMLKMNIKLLRSITLRDENGKSWPVTVNFTLDYHRRYLGSGWMAFRESKNIQLGSRCDFQFVVDKANVARELLVRVLSKIKNK